MVKRKDFSKGVNGYYELQVKKVLDSVKRYEVAKTMDLLPVMCYNKTHADEGGRQRYSPGSGVQAVCL